MTRHPKWIHRTTRVRPRKPGRKFRPRLDSLEDRAVPTAQLWTDRPDYQPGDTAAISGSGFGLGETIKLQVLHTDGTPNTGSGHSPWYVTDGGAGDLDGRVDGRFRTSWYVNPDDSAGSAFRATATGLVSGETAYANFTDSQEDYRHWANMPGQGWQNGALQQSNSAFTEGQSVPQYWTASGQTVGQTYAFNIYYDYAHPADNEGAFSKLAQYNQDFSPPLPAKPGGGIPTADPPTNNAQLEGGGFIFSVGANVTAVSAPVTVATNPQGVQQRYGTVTFTATATTAEFYWGLKLALPGEIAPGSAGAAGWEGASIQTDVRDTPTVPGATMLGGGGSLQINPNAILKGTLALNKTGTWVDANANGYPDVGEKVNYTLVVTNTGFVPLSNVTVTDPKVGPVTYVSGDTDNDGKLDLTENWVFRASYTLTQADIDAGSVYNLATADSTESDPATDDATVLLPKNPVLEVVKTGTWTDGDQDGFADVGEVITYTFAVRNTGNVTLHNVTLTDSRLGPITLSDTTIPVGGSVSGAAVHTVTQADIDAGSLYNLATADSDESGPGTDDETMSLPADRRIELVKTGAWVDANTDGHPDVGEVINYQFKVTNVGNVTLHDITVTDPKVTVAGGPLATLAPGASDSATFTGTYTLTQADIDAGKVDNLALATGTPPSGPNVTDADNATVPLGAAPGLNLIKTGEFLDNLDQDGYADPGEAIRYTFTVTNTGNVHLSNVRVTDPKVTGIRYVSGDTDHDGRLDTAETWTYTGTHLLTQADIDARTYYNTATVTGTAPGGATVRDTADAAVPLPVTAKLDLEKTGAWVDGNNNGFADPGEVVNYQFTVKNIGHVTLHHITVTDPKVTVAGGPVADLPVGGTDSTTFTGRYVLTQADIDAGFVDNLALATGTPTGFPAVTDTDDHHQPLPQNPVITVVKTGTFDAGADGFAQPGELVSYNFLVTNTGNLTLHNVTVTDPLPGLPPISLPKTTLAPGESMTGTATYAVTQADIDTGSVANLATADSDESGPASDGEKVPLPQNAALELVKTGAWVDGDGDGFADPGEVINYAFAVTNTGNVTLHDVTVTDPKVTVVGGPTTLDVGETDSATFTGTYILTQADVDAGFVYNLATADSTESPPDTDDHDQPLVQFPQLDLVKTGTWVDGDQDGHADPGEVIHYQFTVTNTGHVTLHNVTVTDPLVTVTGGPLATLPVGASDSATFTGTYALTQADIDRGFVYNLATADSTESPPDTGDTTVPLGQTPSIDIVKTGTFNAGADGFADPGEKITYKFQVTNTGNVTLFNVKVTDPLPGMSAIVLPKTILAPGESMTGTATYGVTQTDIEAGTVTNLATVNGLAPPNETPVTDNDDAAVELPRKVDIAVRKTANVTVAYPGRPVTYTLRVTNKGSFTLHSFNLTEIFPPYFTPLSFTPATGTYNKRTGIWSGLNFAPGQSIVLRVTGMVHTRVPLQWLTNRVEVMPPAGMTDAFPADNRAARTLPVPSKRLFLSSNFR